jgi:diaminopimelate epimerase
MRTAEMTTIPFYKMSGSGNDFILIDNRHGSVTFQDLSAFASKICRRKLSTGADGLILIESSDTVDFKWRFFNSDGSLAEMCGNGARCAARFAFLTGIAGETMSFETTAGIVNARITGSGVKIKMTDPTDADPHVTLRLKSGPLTLSRINTGVPHAVIAADDIETAPVVDQGREIRFHEFFAPSGTNVNYVSMLGKSFIAVRTYERGVEDETLACGTGSVAAAIMTALKTGMASPVKVLTRGGGSLFVYFRQDAGNFREVYLEGDARLIYKGELHPEAWTY